MTTTTPTKGAVTYSSATTGDTITAGVTGTPYDIDLSGAIYGGIIMVRIVPQAALTTGSLVQLLESDEQGSPAFFNMGVDWVSGLTSAANYDTPWIVSPQARKVRVSIKNQDATNSIKAFVWYVPYTNVVTA